MDLSSALLLCFQHLHQAEYHAIQHWIHMQLSPQAHKPVDAQHKVLHFLTCCAQGMDTDAFIFSTSVSAKGTQNCRYLNRRLQSTKACLRGDIALIHSYPANIAVFIQGLKTSNHFCKCLHKQA